MSRVTRTIDWDTDAVVIIDQTALPGAFRTLRLDTVDELIDAVAEARSQAIGPLSRRLEGQGVQPVTICIGALRHFRILHAAATDPQGVCGSILRLVFSNG